ncbi:MAG: 4Fe-4S binding protein [Saprospiraceae bacterium]|nr:4Fe-4S binding protein [Saprospiraceae bacterium]
MRLSNWDQASGISLIDDLCTGCAVCFEQCPCHAIDMVPEENQA